MVNRGSHVRVSRWGLGLVVGLAAACSPASPIAPDPGQVNIPGFPAGELPTTPTPTPKPTRSPVTKPTPTPFPTPFPTATPTELPTPFPTATSSTATGGSAAAFTRLLATKGITTTPEQLTAIRASVSVRASGDWGTKADFNADETLADDYNRYRLRFTPTYADVKAYKAGAVALANGKGEYFIDAQFYQRYALPLVAKWDSSNRGFIVITADGAVSTYTAVASLAPARYIPVPSDL